MKLGSVFANGTGGRRSMSRRLLVVGLAAAAAGAFVLSGASAPRAKGASVTVRPRTLVASHHEIWAFAQDAGRIAWISRLGPVRGKAGCVLRIRELASGRTSTTRLVAKECSASWRMSALALANHTAAWIAIHSCGNTECYWTIESATAGDRRARAVDAVDVPCFSGICSSVLDPQPLLAGAGHLLVYSNGQGRVERIRGSRARPFFRTSGAVYGLAVGGGRVATVSLSLVPGDSSGRLGVPAWSPDGSKIAYLDGTFREGDVTAAVAVMNADGSGRHDITPSESLGGWPVSLSWSPDGAKIAYNGNGGQIAVANADGSDSSQLVQGYGPAWSPDGSKIAFVRIDYSSSTGGIFVTNPDGTNTHQLMSGSTNIGNPAWSPDGTRIVFSLDGMLEVMNADGSNMHQLGNAVSGDQPAWSPDGSQIVFLTPNSYTPTGLSMIGADGSGLRQLTSGPDEHPSWSPDGKTILFASDRDDPYANADIYNDRKYLELYLVDPDGNTLHPQSFTKTSAWANAVSIRSSAGKRGSTLPGPPAVPGNVTAATSAALTGKIAAVAGILAGGADQITLFQARSGAKLTSVQVGRSRDFTLVGGNSHWVVFRRGKTISALNLHSHNVIRLASAAAHPLGLSVSGRRVAWAENTKIRSVQLPS